MEKKYSSTLLLIALQILIGFIFLALNDFNKVVLINALFISGWILLIIGAFMYVKEKGFFKMSSYGFKKIAHTISKHNSDEGEEEETLTFESYMLKEIQPFTLTLPILFSGCFGVILSFILTYLSM